MVLVENTEEIGNGVGNGEWKIHHKKKPKSQIQNTNKNNKNKHHNQDTVRGMTGTGPTSIIRKSSNYQDGGRRRGGRRDTNQQHVRTTVIRFEDPKPVESKLKPAEPKSKQRQT